MPWPPITMATQHPDNASVPWWRRDAFIPTQDEIDELLLLFKDLPIDEYMWDWEGKYVDEAVGEKLFSRAKDFFADRPLGSSLHLTYRIPAYEEGKMHRLARAFMNLLSLSDLAVEIGLPEPPVTEMFLPLTVKAEQPLGVRKAFKEVAGYHRSVFHGSAEADHELLARFDVTPLVEDTTSLFGIEAILRPYWESLLQERKDLSARGQRIFLARSDPALNAGIVPAVLAVKAALSVSAELGESLGFAVHPVIGTGSLPFRGSVTPETVDAFLEQYAGVRTYSIQSAFRYDYPLEQVKDALEKLHTEVPKHQTQRVPADDRKKLEQLSESFTSIWRSTIEQLAPTINAVAKHVPPRRERLQHIGLFGYSRGVGSVRLPRAIGFTAALYSLGVPPELISTGRGLRLAAKGGFLPLIERYYPALRSDLMQAGAFLNKENVEFLQKKSPVFDGIAEDIAAIEEVLGISLGPTETPHILHRNLTSNICHRFHDGRQEDAMKRDVVEAGVLRRSLG